MRAMLLAAGLGTRLQPATHAIPKPSLELLNIPLLAYPWRLLKTLQCDRLVVNTHHLGKQVQATAKALEGRPQDLVFYDEAPEILGSGGGIRNARPALEGEGYFAVANGDEVFFPHDSTVLKRMMELAKQKGALAVLLTTENADVGTRFGGVWVDEQDRVLGFGKSKWPNSHRGLHFTGFMVLSDRVFDFFRADQAAPNILYDALTDGISKGEEVLTICEPGLWMEVGNPSDFIEASRQLLQQLRSKSNAGLVSLAASYWSDFDARSDVRFPAQSDLDWAAHYPHDSILVGDHVEAQGYPSVKDHVVLGSHTKIAKNCELQDVVIQNGVSVCPDSRLQSQLIAQDIA